MVGTVEDAGSASMPTATARQSLLSLRSLAWGGVILRISLKQRAPGGEINVRPFGRWVDGQCSGC